MIATEQGRITFGLTTVRYTIVRSARRHKTVEVQVDGDRRVRIAAPASASREEVERLLHRRSRWIVARLLTGGLRPVAHEFVNGETFLYLGRQARLRIIEGSRGHGAWVKLARGRLEVCAAPAASAAVRRHRVRAALERWYRERAEVKLRERVAIYGPKLGVEPSAVVVRGQAKRWGSCSKDGVLRFNWRIVIAPMSLLDYVVVHELCHLTGLRPHDASFWATVGSVLPDYELRRARLRGDGVRYATL